MNNVISKLPSPRDARLQRPPAEQIPTEQLSIVDRYLLEQQQLSAVESFATWHDDHGLGMETGTVTATGAVASDRRGPRVELAAAPGQSAARAATISPAPSLAPSPSHTYSRLLPVSAPADDEQYAFEVDLDACSGCKACVTACHSLNGLDDDETWRDVGLLHGGTPEQPWMQHVTAACHHCLDPACMNVCPVRAYEKDTFTGIVYHLDDQCIGCQYCMLACPYNVPKYSKSRGIVRKCDMCRQRLEVDEPPACVQSCPNAAIKITLVKKSELLETAETHSFLPAAPAPSLTLPTTHYRTRRVFPRNILPADYYSVRPEHAHWPLIVMLVLTQLSVGAFLVEVLLQHYGPAEFLESAAVPYRYAALLFGLTALGASVFHLGRPLYAFRAMIGLRTSWLSREILAFSLFAGLAVLYACLPLFSQTISPDETQEAVDILGPAVVLTGIMGVGCSVMIYQCTQRALWSGVATGLRFFATAAILGLSTTSGYCVLAAGSNDWSRAGPAYVGVGRTLAAALIVATTVKLLGESSVFLSLLTRQQSPLKRSAQLMVGVLAPMTRGRFACGVLGGIVLPLLWWLSTTRPDFIAEGASRSLVFWSAVVIANLLGEMLERYLFFTAVVAPRMPGGLRT